MLSPIEIFFDQQTEPVKGCLLFLRGHMKQFNPSITEEWKYGMPFYYLNNKMFCYLWVHKKYKVPYIGFAEGRQLNHPELLIEKRSRMKILLIDPQKNIPLKTINSLLREAAKLY